MSAPFLPYGRQTIEQDDKDAVLEVLGQDFLTTGPKIQEFEKLFSDITGAKESIVVGNGTHALHLACLAADLKEGDAAIVPSITFLATANAVRYCGADVIFSDVNPETGLMEKAHLEKALNDNKDKNIKAVLPVHLGGQTVDLQAIQKLAATKDIKVIADSCHALGGMAGNKPVGSCHYEDMATFSFHPVKGIAMGEGGAITTNNAEVADKIRTLRNHGMTTDTDVGPWYYKMEEMGFNYRVTDMQCALGISQLNKLDRFISKRRELVALYDELLSPLSPVIMPPKRVANCEPGWHLYAPRFNFKKIGMSRAEFMTALKEKNIGSQVHYIPIHTQPYYTDLYGEQDLSGAQEYYESTLSIPLYPTMTEDDVRRVVDEIKVLAT